MRLLFILAAAVCFSSPGQTQPVESHPLTPIPIQHTRIQDDFWTPKIEVWRTITIPDCFDKFEKDRAFNNFDRVRDGKSGEHAGPSFFDGLVYETIRGSADFLAARPDPALEQRLDAYIERIAAAAAKDPDGYLNTWTQLTAPEKRWGLNGGNDVEQHDVYNAGALVEAAIHYYRATGKTLLLQTATRFANHMTDLMGPPPKANIVPGHSLAEEAFVELYRLYREQPALKAQMPVPVDAKRYLDLAEFWIENRGHHEGRDFGRFNGAYAQDHKPVLEQETIEGHAVRATLLCTGLAAAAAENGRQDYLQAAVRLWENMVYRRMYITGGLGAIAGHEGFGPDYELPNNGYLETCAGIGAGFFHRNMNLVLGDARYVDELERTLYNAVLPGVSLAGNTYFYENPLEAGSKRARWPWHGCPCCPPMFLKIMGALPGYIYTCDADALYINLFIGSETETVVHDAKIALRQRTGYPWDGVIELTVAPERPAEFALCPRLPAWCDAPAIVLNGAPVATPEIVRGYARLQRLWNPGDTVTLTLPMPVRRVKAHPDVAADTGRTALQRGPLVYCIESEDNGGNVRNLVLPPDALLTAEHRPDWLGGVTVITGDAIALHRAAWTNRLYQNEGAATGHVPRHFTAIPYYANSNRHPGDMMVWLAETDGTATPRPPFTIASSAIATASTCWPTDTVEGLNDQIEGASSDDITIPRFTWWDHRGTAEWVQYDFDTPRTVSAVEVYWWDERRIQAHCRVPQTWRLLYRAENNEWREVPSPSAYATEMDAYNKTTFTPITTQALRIEAQLQPEWSGGILEWKVE